MKPMLKVALICGALTITLAGCGGSSDSSSTAVNPSSSAGAGSMVVQPSLGQIKGADINVRSLNGTLLTSGTLNAQGVASFDLSKLPAGPYLIEVAGKAGATYYDEGLNADVDFPAGETLHALVTNASGGVGISPLTEVAYQRLLAQKGGKLDGASASDISAVNETVRAQFAPELKSITSAPGLISSTTTAGALDDDEAGRYGLKLAALAKLAEESAELGNVDAMASADVKSAIKALRPALTLTHKLASDFASGQLHDSDWYTVQTFGDRIQDKLSQAAQQYGTDKLTATVNSLQAVPKSVAVDQPMAGSKMDVSILQTTDLHANVRSYDYYKTTDDLTVGFERTATLIDAARKENPNNLLVDDGDTIQGTSLSDYQAQVNPVSCNTPLAIHKAMNFMRYDVGNIGNHEFNYGLPFLAQVTGASMRVPGTEAGKGCMGPKYPLVLANVFSNSDNRPLFSPYVILNRTFTTSDGKKVQLKVGVMGLVPPPIMNWDKRNLDGKVNVIGMLEATKKYVPEMRKAGADLVVVLSHGGISTAPYTSDMENPVYYLTQVPGVDAVVSGHSHSYFPDGVNYANMANVDNVKGTVNGVPTIMAGLWGKALGVMKLNLQYDGKAWQVAGSQASLRYINAVNKSDKVNVAQPPVADAKPEITKLSATEHQGTINYVSGPVGQTQLRISSFFSQVGPTAAMQLINQAQTDYVSKYVKANLPQYANVPILSAAAPFKVNFRGSGFTDIPVGGVAIKNIADLYIYPNTLQAVLIDGATLKGWLEWAAGQFNQIDPGVSTAQNLINNGFFSYNFDQISGITYEIDVTKPLGSRIGKLMYNGQPLDPAGKFIVATNNYRASGGGNVPGLDGTKTILDGGDANRDIIVSYVKALKTLTAANAAAVPNWRFTKVTTAGPVTFPSSPDAAALNVATQDGIANLSVINPVADNNGNAIYAVDLSK